MTKIQLRRDTSTNWTSTNPVLASGEPAFETDTGKFKIGDGVTAYNSLPYKGEGSAGVDDYEDLTSKPQINSVTLEGNKTSTDLGLADSSDIEELGNEVNTLAGDVTNINNELPNKMDNFSSNSPLVLNVQNPNGIQVLNMDNDGVSNCWSELLTPNNSIEKSYGAGSYNQFNYYATKPANWEDIEQICIKVPYQLGQTVISPIYHGQKTSISARCIFGWEDEEGVFIPAFVFQDRNLYAINNPSKNLSYTPAPTTGYTQEGYFSFGATTVSGSYSGGGDTWNNCLTDLNQYQCALRIPPDKSGLELVNNRFYGTTVRRGFTDFDDWVDKTNLDKITQVRFYPYTRKGNSSMYWNAYGAQEEYPMDVSSCAVYNTTNSLSTYNTISALGAPVYKAILKNTISLNYDNSTLKVNDSGQLYAVSSTPNNMVTTDTEQTISGTKTFTNSVKVSDDIVTSEGYRIANGGLGSGMVSLGDTSASLAIYSNGNPTVNNETLLHTGNLKDNFLLALAESGLVTNCVISWGTQKPTTDGTTVTIYTGTKIVCPNGFDSSGKPQNTIYTTTSDITVTPTSNLILVAISTGSTFNCGKFYLRANQSVPEDKAANCWLYSKVDNKNYQYAATPVDPTFNQYDYVPVVGLIKNGGTITQLVLNDFPYSESQLYNTEN